MKKLKYLLLTLLLIPSVVFAEEEGTIVDKGSVTSPLGVITAYAGIESNAELLERGFMVADGSSLRRADYPDLFAIIGTTYGTADNSHFNLPDLKGRTIVGVDSADSSFNTLGKKGGEKEVTLTVAQMPSHTHTFTGTSVVSGTESVGHTHTFSATTSSNGNHSHSFLPNDEPVMGYPLESLANNISYPTYKGWTSSHEYGSQWSAATLAAGAHTHTVSGNTNGVSTTHTHTFLAKGNNSVTGGGKSHNNLQPYLTLKYIIKVK